MIAFRKILLLFMGVGSLVAGDCDAPMGMENGQIPNSALKAASEYGASYGPEYGRLNKPTSYIAKTNNKGQWVQVDFGKVAKVTKIGTQGRYGVNQYITKYTVSYSIDGGFFESQLHKPYNVPRVYVANQDYVNEVKNTLDEPILARYIRIHPVEWVGYISFRFELYGCYSGFSTPKPPACMAGLGLENGNIPDSAITASSMANSYYRADQGRLQAQYETGGYGTWVPSASNNQQWFQVDFGSWTKVARVAIQGRLNAGQWVTKFTLAYSYDGVFYKDYVEDGVYAKQFDGNTDQFTVVSYLLKNPIITRFIRIVPVTWYGAIGLRADFYGCKSGFEIPTIECASSLGMENGQIPDSAIVASSRYSLYWGPERGRLNEKTEGSFLGGWISQYADANQFLQIDLGKVTKVTRIAHQGRYGAGWWTKTYTLSYSNDGAAFTSYKNGEVLQGNTDYTTAVGRILDPPIIARFIKINVKTYNGYPSLRVELYGCTDGFSTPKPPQCMDALGMESGDIPDSAVTASSSAHAVIFAPSVGRLHFLSSGSGKYCWVAGTNDKNQWFQVDFGSWTKVTAVATQGRQDTNQWVTKYKLSFSYDGVFYENVDQGGEFDANSDRYTVVKNVLDKPIITRYIRINPESWYAHISMRTEFFGCKEGFDTPKVVCVTPLGIENGQIPDSAIVASSEYNQYYGAERARLREVTEGSYVGGWSPKAANQGQWIQFDLGKNTKVTRMAIQGRDNANWWTTSYSLSFKIDGGSYESYNNGQVFAGNIDRNTPVGNIINPPIIARYIKVHPKTWYGFISMRVELYGCREGFTTPKPPTCAAALGMQNNQIPDSALRASTSYNAVSMGPANGRLHFQAESGKYGSWAVSTNNEFQYFEVNFGGWTQVTKVATQGRQDGAWWTKSYSLAYSYDGVFFVDYKEDDIVKVFAGNVDQYSVVTHTLKNPIITRYLRIKPKTWNSYIALRAEFYGCRQGFTPPEIKCRDSLGLQKGGKIPSTAIVASTMYNQYYGPDRGRLRMLKEGSYAGGWAAQYNDGKQFLQVDLGSVSKVTAVATQGLYEYNWMVSSYTLAYSLDAGSFTPYGDGDGQVFTGNNLDRNEPIGNIIDPPIIARFIQIRVKTYKGHTAMRAEFYGCTDGFTKPKPPVCLEALGMQNENIPDSAISASTEYNAYGKAIYGRLHSVYMSGGRYGAWLARLNDDYQFLQVDFGSWTKVSRVAIQGRSDANQWVKSFSLSYGYDPVFFKDYKEDGSTKVFSGSNDRYTPVSHDLKDPIITRYIRIHPKSYQSHTSMRAEFYGCKDGFDPPTLECQSDLGMKSGQIPNSAITATSILNQYYGTERARLDTVKSGSYAGAWIPKANDLGQWIEVDLGKITKITRIATQGRQDAGHWVKSYSLSYSVEGGPFLPYNNDQILPGNTDMNTIVGNILNPSIIARYLRIHPKTFQGYMALRFELYGCTDGFSLPQVPSCQIQLGMQNGKLPDSALSASSELNAACQAENARLHFQTESGRYGAWIPKVQDHNQWLEVDFGVETQITRIATQGRQDANQWVKEYTLRYSTDGSYFKQYQPSGFTKTFDANSDRYTVVAHDLNPPISAQYLRIIPEEWQTYIALRAEFYGCKTNDGGYTAWSSWSQCSATCGDGRHTRSRSCTNPPPSPGGKDCSQLGPDTETGECNNGGCPVDGGYSAWGDYGECSKSCGGGEQTKSRTCTNPPPAYGGKDCSGLGESTSSRECNNQGCPVDGGYSNWDQWSDCSVSCGKGRQTRRRKCNNPVPQNGGKDCSTLGKSMETADCNAQKCPVDGGYGPWDKWSQCSRTCGLQKGTRTRNRLCNNPPPESGGKDCSALGLSSQTKNCRPAKKVCPVDGNWSNWRAWNKCSVTCGGGKRKRTRSCTNPKPRGGGKKCEGSKVETQECNTNECGPEWKPVGCYKNVDRALDKVLGKVWSKTSVAGKTDLCTTPADNEGITLVGLDNKRCWTKGSDYSSYSKYGTSANCKTNAYGKGTGFAASGTVFVLEKDQGVWKTKNCYVNESPKQALPDSFDNNVDEVKGNDNIFKHCAEKAEAFGYKVFGADDKNCWSGDMAETTYDDHGTSSQCAISKSGNGSGKEINLDMFVYRLE